jgi:hypothetical protein
MGSLTQKVLGTAKNVALVVFCMIFLGERVTLRQWCGYQASLIGFAWCQVQKLRGAGGPLSPAAAAARPSLRSAPASTRSAPLEVVAPSGAATATARHVERRRSGPEGHVHSP